MVEYVKPEKEEKKAPKKFNWLSFKGFLIIFLIFFILSSFLNSITLAVSPKLAIVPINGVLMTEESMSIYGSTKSSRNIADTLYELKNDKSIKAVILDINSPGGSPVATEEISRAIEELKKEKEVYALISDVGASGAFWIAMSSDKVYASSMSTLGSIGVTSASLGFENFIKDYNITYRRLTAGEYKDMGSPFREQSEEENQLIQEILDEIHNNFITHVASSRNLSYEFVKEYSEGQIFLGSKALELGFIDEIGYMPDLIAEFEKKYGNLMIINYAPSPTFFQLLGLHSLMPSFQDDSKIMLK